jgi:hypothetical protein
MIDAVVDIGILLSTLLLMSESCHQRCCLFCYFGTDAVVDVSIF